MVESLLAWVETTRIAAAVGGSSILVGSLSSIHLLGFTLITGGALVSNLRLLGVLFADRPVREVVGPTFRGIEVGLLISIPTGFLMFTPRAMSAFANETFRLKMLLLLTAAVLHFAFFRRIARGAVSSTGALKAAGAMGLALWLGVGLAGCAFILLE
jgi:hypothetical protein